jgi:integrase
MPTKITKALLERLHVTKAGERALVFDTELTGFGVRATPGLKTFFVQYRAGSGRAAPKRRISLGQYGALTVEQARRLAKEILGEVARGSDPAASRNRDKSAPTVAAHGADYLDDVRARRKPTTAREYARLWQKHVISAIGTRRVADVSPADIARIHRALHQTPYCANRVLALLGSFFAYAERQGIRPKHTNPAHEVGPYAEKSRERFMTPSEVARLGEALTRAERIGLPVPEALAHRGRGMSHKRRAKLTGKKRGPYKRTQKEDSLHPANPFAVAAIRFLLLTGWREGEALTLKWSDVNFERGTATLTDTKTGRSQRVIGAPAMLVLSQLPNDSSSPYIFTGRDVGKPLRDLSRVWYAVRSAAKLDDLRLHDLRHSFASVTASSGGSLLLIGKLLGHKDTSTTAKYAHLLDDPVRAAADTASKSLAAWLSGEVAAKPRSLRTA